MLQYDPAKRPTASECLQYPFFRVRVPIPLSAPDYQDEDQIIDSLLQDPLGEDQRRDALKASP